MDGKNVVNIIYSNIYISPNNVSQNWPTLIMLLHSYIIYIGLMSTLFPLPFPFKQTFPLLPMQKTEKKALRGYRLRFFSGISDHHLSRD